MFITIFNIEIHLGSKWLGLGVTVKHLLSGSISQKLCNFVMMKDAKRELKKHCNFSAMGFIIEKDIPILT